jgi:N-formylglutamate amidohydrolase
MPIPLPRWIIAFTALALISAQAATPKPIFGDNGYIEYIPGDMPLVISSPHGGRETPAEIPTREQGVVQMDTNTQELARAIVEEFHARTGHRPYLIVCRLHRQKLDVNREVVEAAAGQPVAEKAWGEYHAFVEQAMKAAAQLGGGKAFYIDLHGQAHKDKRIELGYLHGQDILAKPEAELNSAQVVAQSSIRRLAERSKQPYVALLRGPRSLGALLEARAFPCTPSPERPVPNLPYFRGGYSVRRHAWTDSPVAGLQIETNYEGLRDTAPNRAKFAAALVAALREYLPEQYGLTLPGR